MPFFASETSLSISERGTFGVLPVREQSRRAAMPPSLYRRTHMLTQSGHCIRSSAVRVAVRPCSQTMCTSMLHNLLFKAIFGQDYPNLGRLCNILMCTASILLPIVKFLSLLHSILRSVLSDVMTTCGMQGSMCVSVARCRWIYARSYILIISKILDTFRLFFVMAFQHLSRRVHF